MIVAGKQVVPNRYWSLFMTVVLLAFSSIIVNAQGVGSSRGLPSSSGGVHTIKGRVFFPDDVPPGTRIKVTLETRTLGNLVTSTDDDGQFMFTRLDAGSYAIVVGGDNKYETIREPVEIDRASPGGRTLDVPLYLKFKPSANPAFANVPKNALDAYNKAQAAKTAGDSKKVIELLNEATTAHANFAVAYNELGVEYLKAGDVEKAADALQKAVKLTPNDFQPRLNLGIALLNQKKFPEAEEQLKQALAKNANSPVAHMYLGMALMNQKKLDDAQKELETAVATKSSEVGIAHKYLGGIYWGLRDYKRAADELEMYLKLVPKAADAERTKAAIKDLRTKQ